MTNAQDPLAAGSDNAAGPLSTDTAAASSRKDRAGTALGAVDTGARPAAGHVIINPISGEHIVIRQSGAQTGGQVLSFDLYLPPGAHVPARHVHPMQEEHFTVVAGQMRFRLGRFGRRTILAQPGDTIRVPAGTAHWFGNAGPDVAHALVEARPALRLEEMFETAAAMPVTRLLPGAPLPRLADLALFLSEFQQELAVPEVPARLVRAVLAPLAWVGRRRGRTPRPASTR
jgi:quercetin dioxygenase-like cupin family protein